MKTIAKTIKMALKFIDIAPNLTDPMFSGVYGGNQKHPNDLPQVLKRAWDNGVEKMIITVGTLDEAEEALKLAKSDERLYLTMGCHPTRCGEFVKNPEKYYQGLSYHIQENPGKVVAIGECGLDYDRLHFCDAETQRQYFEKQLGLAVEYKLPLFLHCRNASEDFMEILERNKTALHSINKEALGVVHSFDGSLEEAKRVLEFGGLYIGLNGCSLKNEANLQVVKELPNDRILLETDCPWCGIRPTHAGYKYVNTKFPSVKKKEKWTCDTLIDGRNEPCNIRQVLEVIAGVKQESEELLAQIIYNNTMKLFFKRN